MSQEWAEWGASWGEVWRKEFAMSVALRQREPRAMLGDFADIGAGHFDFNHASANILALFIRKAAAARLPADGYARLKPISLESGVLVDPAALGTATFKAIPYREWTGDRSTAFWYLDAQLATAINDSMLINLSKKPQAIDYVVDGKPVPLLTNGFAPLKPDFLADGITFRLHAESLTTSPSASLYEGTALGHASTPITYRVSTGALEQVGPDTFRVAGRAGGLTRQGMPWEPWIQAIKPGDADYRSTDKPAHILIDIRNTKGTQQSLTFTQPADVSAITKSIPLDATASSGLPVQFYVESGPAVVEGNQLRLTATPPRSRYPIRVIVSAYQWGRVGDKPIQSAGPETREFLITR